MNKMKILKSVLCLFLFAFCFSCSTDYGKLITELSNMKDSKVTFSSLDYEVINMQKHKQTQSNYSWYIFLSKDFCKACFLERIPKWEMMINNTKKESEH